MKKIKTIWLFILAFIFLFVTKTFMQTATENCGGILQNLEVNGELERPEYVSENTIISNNFIVHYTTDNNSIHKTTSAYANLVSNAAENSFSIECSQMGWRLPRPDDNRGGDNKYDIYIREIFARGITYEEVEEGWTEIKRL